MWYQKEAEYSKWNVARFWDEYEVFKMLKNFCFLVILCLLLIGYGNVYAASDSDTLKFAKKILSNHLDNEWHDEASSGYNNCRGDNDFEVKYTDAKIKKFEIVENEGVGSLSSGLIRIQVMCKITTYRGGCTDGVGNATKPRISKPIVELSMSYLFKGKSYVNLGVLTRSTKIANNLPEGLKPIEYKGCGAETINARREPILDDAIITLP